MNLQTSAKPSATWRKVIAAFSAIAAVTSLIIWNTQNPPEIPPETALLAEAPSKAAPSNPPPSALVQPSSIAQAETQTRAASLEGDEEKIQTWLTQSPSTDAAAEAFLANWERLSEAGKLAAAPHMVNLVPDARHAALAGLLLNPQTSSGVKQILFADTLNRPDAIKWPLLLKVMEAKSHPFSMDARNTLSLVLGTDAGDDWPRWRELVRTRLLPAP